MRDLWDEITNVCRDCMLHTLHSPYANPLNVNTYNLRLQYRHPTTQCRISPETCKHSCVIPHLNAVRVAEFVNQYINDHQGIDAGYIACINYVNEPGIEEYSNASWMPDERAIFGQKYFQDGRLYSYALSLTVVAHEFGHKLIYETVKLTDQLGNQRLKGFEYKNESGALDESYADIFAILVANRNKTNISHWNWDIGHRFGENGGALRDLRCPMFYDQPEHIMDYHDLPSGEDASRYNDWGNVHTNSGIHNKAIYYLLTTKNELDEYLFDVSSATKLFYRALCELSRTDGFTESRQAFQAAAKSIFENEPDKMQRILNAIANAFDRVGINQPEINPPQSNTF